MSDDVSSTAFVPGDGGAGVYSVPGSRIPPARRSHTQTDQLADFVQQQPLATALIALIIGYLLGKIT